MPNIELYPKPNDILLSGQRIRVWTGGQGQAPLLLHSAWGDANLSWAPVWNELSRSFTVIAPDLPGFGASEPFRLPSLAANAHLLRDLLDLRKVESAIVLGNSFGAAIALEFAAIFSDRTRCLVLVNGGFLPALPGFIKKILDVPFLEKQFRSLMRSMTYSDKAFARAFPNPSKLPPKFFEQIRANEEQQAEVVFDTFRNQAAPQRILSVPVTILWGTGDRLTTMKQAGLIRTWPFETQHVSIAGAGHMPQVGSFRGVHQGTEGQREQSGMRKSTEIRAVPRKFVVTDHKYGR